MSSSKPIVVVLCGSTRFADAYRDAQRRETLAGRIVLSVGLLGHQEGIDMDGPVKKMLDELHLRKIDESDEVLVLDPPLPRCPKCLAWAHGAAAALHSQGFCIRCSRCDCPVEDAPYLGESARREIEYALKKGKKVRYLSQEAGRKP